jgi:hypothetical protein
MSPFLLRSLNIPWSSPRTVGHYTAKRSPKNPGPRTECCRIQHACGGIFQSWYSQSTKIQSFDPGFSQVFKVQGLNPGFLVIHKHQAKICRLFIWRIFYHTFCLVLKIYTGVWIFVLILIISKLYGSHLKYLWSKLLLQSIRWIKVRDLDGNDPS